MRVPRRPLAVLALIAIATLVRAADPPASPTVTVPLLDTPAGHPGYVLAVSPDGRWVATNPYAWSTAVQIWDVRTGGLLSTARVERARLYERAVASPDGRKLAVYAMAGKDWDKDWGPVVIDADTGRQTVLPGVGYILGFTADASAVYTLRPGGQRTGQDAVVTVWSLSGAKPLREFTVPKFGWVAVAPDGQTAHHRADTGVHEVWNFATGKRVCVLTGEGKEKDYRHDFLAFAGGGKKVVTVVGGHTLWVFDATTGKREQVIGVPKSADILGVNLIGVADDLSLVLAAAIQDGYFAVFEPGKDGWRWTIPRIVSERVLHTRSILMPDGKRAVRLNPIHGAEVFDAATGRHVHTMRPDTQHVRALAFAADGKSLVAATANNAGYRTDPTDPPAAHVLVWDAATGELRKALAGIDPKACRVFPTADGAKAVVVAGAALPDYYGSWTQQAVLWDLTTGKELRTIAGPKDTFYGFAASADGRRLAAVLTESRKKEQFTEVFPLGTRVWDLPTGDRVRDLDAVADTRILSFTADGERVLAHSHKTGVESWGVEGNKGKAIWKPAPTVADTRTPFMPVALPRGDEFVALCGSGPRSGGVYWYTAGRQIRFGIVPILPGPLAVSPDGKWVAAGEQPHVGPGRVFVWKLPDPPPFDENTIKNGVIPPEEFPVEPVVLHGHTGPVHALAFSPDGRTLATGGIDCAVRVWDVSTGRLKATLWVPPAAKPGDAPTDWVAFTPDGHFAGTKRGIAFLRVWDADVFTFFGARKPAGSVSAAELEKQLLDPAKVRASLNGRP